jgi:hypothetical protein
MSGLRASGAGKIARPTDMCGWLLLWAWMSALLMAVSSLGPWLKVPYTDYLTHRQRLLFLDDGGLQRGHGWFVLVAAVLGAVALVVWRQRRTAGVAALLAGLVGLGITLHAATNVNGLRPETTGLEGVAIRYGFDNAGWGLELALLASLSFALCGLVWLLALADPPGERSASNRNASSGFAELH